MARIRRTNPVMGTWASIHVHDDVPESTTHAAIDAVFAELARLEDVFSTFRPSSEISRVNRGECHLTECSADVIEVLDACTWLEQASGGAFDIRPRGLAGPIDPAGFVKGWATERAAHHLGAAGLRNWYVSVGGDVVVSGRPAPDRFWRVGIVDPTDATRLRAKIDVERGAVATSGTAARGNHLWDARRDAAGDVPDSPDALVPDALVPDAFVSVTVTGPTLTWADAFATTVFVMGDPGLVWLGRFAGYEAVAVRADGSLVATDGYASPANSALSSRRSSLPVSL